MERVTSGVSVVLLRSVSALDVRTEGSDGKERIWSFRREVECEIYSCCWTVVDDAVMNGGSWWCYASGAPGSRINSRYWLIPSHRYVDIRLFRVSRVNVIPGAWVTSSLSWHPFPAGCRSLGRLRADVRRTSLRKQHYQSCERARRDSAISGVRCCRLRV